MIEFLDSEGTVQLVQEIKGGVTDMMHDSMRSYSNINIGTSWTGSVAPYSQAVEVIGMKSTDIPIVDVVPESNNYNTAQNQLNAWAEIYKCIAADNGLIVYAHHKTSVPIPIQIVCVSPVGT